MEYSIDELTALVLQHSRLARQLRKSADEHDKLAQVYLEIGKRSRRDAEAKESKLNIQKIITSISMLILVSFLMMGSLTLAQDTALVTNTPQAAATAEVTAEVTQEPVTTHAPASQPADNTALILETLKELALIAALIMLAFKVAGLVTPDVLDKALARGFDLAKGLADTTPTPIDNRLLEIAQPIISKIIDDELAKRATVTITQSTLQSNTTVPTIGGTSTFTDVG